MLSPEARTVAIELLRPPDGYRLNLAVLTTFSLDLEVMLALPLAVLAHADGGLDELLADPLLLLQALRDAGERIQVFVDESRIAVPRTARPLYAVLEPSVHLVRAPNGGAFHPKVWIARFESEGAPPLLRVAVLSRNLTFDRSWDVALVSEASPSGQRRASISRPLGELLHTLSELATEPLEQPLATALHTLATEVERTRFPAPGGFDEHIAFHLLGMQPKRRRPWRPHDGGSRLLAIAPFVNRLALDAVADMSTGEHILVSRSEELDKLSDDALAQWDRVFVLSDSAQDEPEDGTSARPSGLHAKVIAIEQGWDVTWFVGSANLTAAAFLGVNVEVMASITGRKGRKSGTTGSGIERFLESGFIGLCEPYRRVERMDRTDPDAATADIEQARDRLVEANLKVICRPGEGAWIWRLEGEVSLPDDIEVTAWPVTVQGDHARALELPLMWTLPISRLTAFVAFRLRSSTSDIEDIRTVLKLPAEGMPEGRISQVLRTLIDSPERLLRFLRALLGGLEGMVDWAQGDGAGTSTGPWKAWLGGETLLEDLLRVASRDPTRLERVRRLFEDLRDTEDGRKIVPEELLTIWTAVDQALAARNK